MKLLEKIQTVRIELQKLSLKKSGQNGFANFYYYELTDILPAINSACLNHKMATVFNSNDTTAQIEIRDFESEEVVKFEIPFKMPEIKGANAVQCLGGAITYLRRYLLINAFEICENDPNDAVIGKQENGTETKKPATQKESVNNVITDKDIKICGFGKDINKRWDSMDDNRLDWYIAYFEKKIETGGIYLEKNKAILNYLLELKSKNEVTL